MWLYVVERSSMICIFLRGFPRAQTLYFILIITDVIGALTRFEDLCLYDIEAFVLYHECQDRSRSEAIFCRLC